MRRIIHRFDAFLCRSYGVFEFSQDSQALLRLQLTHAHRPLMLKNKVVDKGAPVFEFHLWNDHLPILPPEGPDLAWANALGRFFIRSLHDVAQFWKNEPRFSNLQAIGGVTSLFSATVTSGGLHMMKRLGFTVVPYQSRLGAFGEFWENFYAWWLLWSYNSTSLQDRSFWHVHRSEMWMASEDFLKRF